MKLHPFIYCVALVGMMSFCHLEKDNRSYSLNETNKELSFSLNSQTKNWILALFPYTDKNNKKYITFQNAKENNILFYNIETGNLEFQINPDIAGDNGVGRFLGYYIHNFDSIFLTTGENQEIAIIDTSAHLKVKINYEKTTTGFPLQKFYSMSSTYHPIVMINDNLYIMPECNRWAKKNPVTAIINLSNRDVNELPFSYPIFPTATNKAKRAGVELHVSRCFDGKNFVYSFYYDENIYIASLNHSSVDQLKIKSKFINKIKVIDDYGKWSFKDVCENPSYGNMLYDPYRKIYYRIAYPENEIEKNINPMELLQYGRKNFSIIILDNNFNVIGETRFPDYTYNSNLMFVNEDGLYISDSHCFNSHFSDDVLSFKCFTLIKNKN